MASAILASKPAFPVKIFCALAPFGRIGVLRTPRLASLAYPEDAVVVVEVAVAVNSRIAAEAVDPDTAAKCLLLFACKLSAKRI